jgi:hypothetical protein
MRREVAEIVEPAFAGGNDQRVQQQSASVSMSVSANSWA